MAGTKAAQSSLAETIRVRRLGLALEIVAAPAPTFRNSLIVYTRHTGGAISGGRVFIGDTDGARRWARMLARFTGAPIINHGIPAAKAEAR